MKDKEEAKKYARDLYYYYKNKGICPNRCKQEAEPNKVFCFECAEARNKRMREKYKENQDYKYTQLENTKRRAKERRKKRKEQGLCIICGKRKINKPYSETRCIECYIKRKQSEKRLNKNKILRHDRYFYDLCYNCSKKGLYNGTHYCKECWTKMSEHRKKWWQENNIEVEKEGLIEGKVIDKRIKKNFVNWKYYGLFYPNRFQLLIQRKEYEVWIDVNIAEFKKHKVGEFYKIRRKYGKQSNS